MLTTRTISTRYADIALTESDATGLPVLLLHGTGSSRKVFDRQLDSPLADRFHLIAMDLPGHGESSDAFHPEKTYTQFGYANTVAAVIEEMQIEHCAVVGWSLGGHVAMELMSFHHAVCGVMLTGAPPVGRGLLAMLRGFHTSWDMLLASKEHFSTRDTERFLALCYGNDTTPELRADAIRADGRARTVYSRSTMRGEGADQRRTVEQSAVPLAIINGETDPFIRLSYFESVPYGNLWEGVCRVLPGAGHAAFRDKPATFNALLTRFAGDVALQQLSRYTPNEAEDSRRVQFG